MAEATAPEPQVVEPNTTDAAAVDMVVENAESAEAPGVDSEANGESNQKRAREEDEKEDASKKQKADKEEEEEEEEELNGEEEEEKKLSGPVKLGPKCFGSSLEMFDYFYSFLHAWPPYLNVNKYEHMVLVELLKKGHPEPDKKIGGGVCAFQVRKHPTWKSRYFFLIREDESVDDFSFRKCVDHILPLPEAMQLKPDVNKALGGGKRHGGRGGGRGRKGKSRH